MLALVGSGEYLPPMGAVDRVLLEWLSAGRGHRPRAHGPPRVACLATAAASEGQAVVDRWQQMGVDHFQGLGAEVAAVPVVDRATAGDPELAAQIAAADLVYLSAGKPSYLYQSLAGTAAWAAILSVHRRGGLVAGCSAGAMVMGQYVLDFPRLGLEEGFGLLPGVVVMPHFDEVSHLVARLTHLLAGRELTLVGVEGMTALLVDGTGGLVLGSGRVAIWDGRGLVHYAAGPLPAGLALDGRNPNDLPL
jgi:cyanophycinase